MDLEDLRLSVYHRFACTGSAPAPAELAVEHGVSVDDVRAGLAAPAAARQYLRASGLSGPFWGL
ncbi:hypothetical protein [Actinoplanes solisilvae]|uniref:hypothetical protein n=1 Tax=Actinoplanes solisilvae TaxID=2486853 RepID=UPI000FD75835|nr:hypothetical protein [Actinoplanes solisilvae]